MLTRRAMIATGLSFTATAALAQKSGTASVIFTPEVFEAAQAAGKPIMIEITAPWCPVCKVQGGIIKTLMNKPEFKNVQIMKVDFDSEKDALKTFKVSQQSTLIAFKGKTEINRSTGETAPGAIESLFKALI